MKRPNDGRAGCVPSFFPRRNRRAKKDALDAGKLLVISTAARRTCVTMTESFLIAAGAVLASYGLMCAYNRWIQPRFMRRGIDKAVARVRERDYVPPTPESDFGLSVDASGITVSRRPAFAPLHTIAWSEIVRVVAFKRDWLTVDCICLAIAMTDGTTTEVNEEMEGWEALTNALPEHLPGSKLWSECFSQVAFPAFATNKTVVFERKSSPQVSKVEKGR